MTFSYANFFLIKKSRPFPFRNAISPIYIKKPHFKSTTKRKIHRIMAIIFENTLSPSKNSIRYTPFDKWANLIEFVPALIVLHAPEKSASILPDASYILKYDFSGTTRIKEKRLLKAQNSGMPSLEIAVEIAPADVEVLCHTNLSRTDPSSFFAVMISESFPASIKQYSSMPDAPNFLHHGFGDETV